MQSNLAFGTAPHPARRTGSLACNARRRVMTSADLSGVLMSQPKGALHPHTVEKVAESAETSLVPADSGEVGGHSE
jgi:hypothetical protein